MKKNSSIIAVLFILLATTACQQKEEKSQISYTPPGAPVPSLMQIDQMQQAATMAPRNAQAWINLGNSLMDAQRFGEAVDAYQKALVLEPKNVPVMVDQGTCYRGIGKYDKAVEQYRKALKLEPNFPNGHRNLGVVLSYDLHDTAQGIKEFKRYVELAPDAPDVESVRRSIMELSANKPLGK